MVKLVEFRAKNIEIYPVMKVLFVVNIWANWRFCKISFKLTILYCNVPRRKEHCPSLVSPISKELRVLNFDSCPLWIVPISNSCAGKCLAINKHWVLYHYLITSSWDENSTSLNSGIPFKNNIINYIWHLIRSLFLYDFQSASKNCTWINKFRISQREIRFHKLHSWNLALFLNLTKFDNNIWHFNNGRIPKWEDICREIVLYLNIIKSNSGHIEKRLQDIRILDVCKTATQKRKPIVLHRCKNISLRHVKISKNTVFNYQTWESDIDNICHYHRIIFIK